MTGATDAERFRSAFRNSYPLVLAYALRRTAGHGDAEDVAAETFLVAWRRIEQMPSRPEERNLWFYGIARKVLANQRRSSVRAKRLELRIGVIGPPPPDPSADDVIAAASDVRDALWALRTLKERDREVLMLSLWEELSHAEIAAVTGTSVANVAVRLHRAKDRLRRRFASLMQEHDSFGHVPNESTRRERT